MLHPRFATSLILLLSIVWCAPVSALLVGGSNLRVEINGPADLVGNYTIGLYNRGAMTAAVDDPDFQTQALQADRVILLQEYGQPAGQNAFDFRLGDQADIGIFLLRNASLRDFSLGEHSYQPIFSTEGAPGSNLFNLVADDNGAIVSLKLPGGTRGGVMPAGFGLTNTGEPSLTISLLNYGYIEPLLLNDMNPRSLDQPVDEPVVPEPATIVLFGLGLAGAGALRRFKSAQEKR